MVSRNSNHDNEQSGTCIRKTKRIDEEKLRDLTAASQTMHQLDVVNKEILILTFGRRYLGKEVELNTTVRSCKSS